MDPTTTDPAAEFAARLREAREAAGLSQEALGDRCGWSRQRILVLERGDWMPRRETVSRIAGALGVAPGDLDGRFAAIEVPPGAVALTPDREVEGCYRPWRAEDAAALEALGWPAAVGHGRLDELARALRESRRALCLVP